MIGFIGWVAGCPVGAASAEQTEGLRLGEAGRMLKADDLSRGGMSQRLILRLSKALPCDQIFDLRLGEACCPVGSFLAEQGFALRVGGEGFSFFPHFVGEDKDDCQNEEEHIKYVGGIAGLCRKDLGECVDGCME